MPRREGLPGLQVRHPAGRLVRQVPAADIDLPTLAEQLGVSPHHLSQVLNDRFQRNFYDFINAYRVEEVKRRLVDPAHRQEKVLSIGLDCGFSSKSTLDAAFKKWTGMTPSAFRKEHGAGDEGE